MINLKHGDILASDAEAIVNTVNCVGVMGKGIALQFKMKYPDNYYCYKKICDQGKMLIGKVLTFELSSSSNPKYIFNFPTKRHWKAKSKIDDILKGLDSLIFEVKRLKIKSIAIPALGSGLGGLEWGEVKALIINVFSEFPEINVSLYEPQFKFSTQSMIVNTKKPNITLAKALLIKLLQVYQVLGYPHSLLEIQKLMYFVDVLLDKELKLQFVKEKYGPYTNQINHLLQAMEKHYTRGYGDRVQKSEIRLLEDAIKEADAFFLENSQYLGAIKKIEQLIDGFETPFGMELLATVHWVATRECKQPLSRDQVISKVHCWNVRKKQLFQINHIDAAVNRLIDEQWIPPCFS